MLYAIPIGLEGQVQATAPLPFAHLKSLAKKPANMILPLGVTGKDGQKVELIDLLVPIRSFDCIGQHNWPT